MSEKKKCCVCKKVLERKCLNIKDTSFRCKRCNYLGAKSKKYGFKNPHKFEEWYMKQWHYQLGFDPLGAPLPNPNPCPEWEGAADVEHNHDDIKTRGLCSPEFNHTLPIFEYKTREECVEIANIIYEWLNYSWKPNEEMREKYLQQQKRQEKLKEWIKAKENYEKDKIGKKKSQIIHWLKIKT